MRIGSNGWRRGFRCYRLVDPRVVLRESFGVVLVVVGVVVDCLVAVVGRDWSDNAVLLLGCCNSPRRIVVDDRCYCCWGGGNCVCNCYRLMSLNESLDCC